MKLNVQTVSLSCIKKRHPLREELWAKECILFSGALHRPELMTDLFSIDSGRNQTERALIKEENFAGV